jgi:bifunctional UDP-N-acetylglucosamine pyrophosphorylase/glucosamine-1-phosphate N-acetyltransferase
MKINAVILAAGLGTRMRSATPKALHPLLGRPMVWYAIESAQKASGSKPVLIIGHGAEAIREIVGEAAYFALQEPQLGTGHAVMQAEPLLKGKTDLVLVTSADMPLLSAKTLDDLIQAHQDGQRNFPQPCPMTILTVIAEDARGFGRVIRASGGEVKAVIEEAQANQDQLAINELNASVYCFNANWLWEALNRISLTPKGEYYLTDLVGIAVDQGLPVQALTIQDASEAIGINTRIHLSEAEAILRGMINQEWMLSGVTMIDPNTTYIEPGVEIGKDTLIWPNTFLQGNTRIGQACTLGPDLILRDSQIGNHSKVFASVLEKAIVEDEVEIGPFAHLRQGAHLANGTHMGNFGEVKNSYLGPGTKMGHFSYVGDTTIGAKVNIGAGTVTCNFDGKKKNPTVIGNDVFIGSDTMLVAPVKLGDGAHTGAGSVVTKDVPPHTLAVGVPARAIKKIEKSDK